MGSVQWKKFVMGVGLMSILPCAAAASNTSFAATIPSEEDSAVTAANTRVERVQQDETSVKRQQIASEAIAAISETHNALIALDAGKNQVALSALERAIGKLELILARAPHLALAPVDVTAITVNVNADITTINQVRKKAEDLLAAGQIQAARHLLEGLASETVINVTSIPLATYPSVIQQTVKLLDTGKSDQAKMVLQTALNKLVITRVIIPLPVVTAEELLKQAEKLAAKNNRTAEENTKLSDLLNGTGKELKFAQALGYGTQQDFDRLYQQLNSIEDKTSSGKFGTGFFTRIKQYLEDMRKSNQSGQ